MRKGQKGLKDEVEMPCGIENEGEMGKAEILKKPQNTEKAKRVQKSKRPKKNGQKGLRG